MLLFQYWVDDLSWYIRVLTTKVIKNSHHKCGNNFLKRQMFLLNIDMPEPDFRSIGAL